MDPYRNETFTERLLRKRGCQPLNIVVHKRSVTRGNQFFTALIAAMRYNHTRFYHDDLDGEFSGLPVSVVWDLSHDPAPTKDQIEGGIGRLCDRWRWFQPKLAIQWNVEFDEAGALL